MKEEEEKKEEIAKKEGRGKGKDKRLEDENGGVKQEVRDNMWILTDIDGNRRIPIIRRCEKRHERRSARAVPTKVSKKRKYHNQWLKGNNRLLLGMEGPFRRAYYLKIQGRAQETEKRLAQEKEKRLAQETGQKNTQRPGPNTKAAKSQPSLAAFLAPSNFAAVPTGHKETPF